MEKIEISKMTASDLNLIAPILTSEFDEFWNFNNLKSEFENSNSTCIIAKRASDIIGFACIWKAVDDIHITNIVVKKSFRKKGIGSLLLETLINLCRDQNIQLLTLEVNSQNISAINLYEKYNFKKVGIRKRYYNGSADAVIMTKEVNK